MNGTAFRGQMVMVPFSSCSSPWIVRIICRTSPPGPAAFRRASPVLLSSCTSFWACVRCLRFWPSSADTSLGENKGSPPISISGRKQASSMVEMLKATVTIVEKRTRPMMALMRIPSHGSQAMGPSETGVDIAVCSGMAIEEMCMLRWCMLR